jgi:pseudouridine kinase
MINGMLGDFSPSPHAPVLVIGAGGIDIVGRLDGDLETRTSNPSSIRSSFGGVARNVAENLAHLGHPVTYITAVGEDQPGDQLVSHLRDAGVNVEFLVRCADCPTGSYIAVLDTAGELIFALDDMRAISELTSAYLRSHLDLFKHASMLFLDANLSSETLRTAFSLARRYKIPVCADPTSTSLANRLIPHLDQLHLITPNTGEAGILCDSTDGIAKRSQAINAAQYLVSQGVDIAIITMAQLGVCYATSQTNGHIPALRTETVDPTGAGDALTAAVLFALLNDIHLDEAIRLGVTAASLTLRYPGAVIEDLSLEKLYNELVI